MEYTKVIFEANDQKEIADFVEKFKFQLIPGGKIKTVWGNRLKLDEVEFAKNNKEKIIQYLENKEKNVKDRLKKIDSIPGLKEVKNAILDFSSYNSKFRHALHDEDNDGAFLPKKPKHDLSELKKKYPAAFLWEKAQDFLNASNYKKSAAGREAQDFILDGDLKKAEKAMDNWTGDGPFWD